MTKELEERIANNPRPAELMTQVSNIAGNLGDTRNGRIITFIDREKKIVGTMRLEEFEAWNLKGQGK